MASRSAFEQPEFQLARWIASADAKKTRRFRAGQLFELRRRSRWRQSFHGAQSVHPRLHARTSAWHFLHRHQGREGQGGLVQFHIRRLDHRRPARDLAIHRARSSSGEEPTGSISCVASFSRTAGCLMISATSLLILSMIGWVCRQVRSGRSRHRLPRRYRLLSASARPANRASAWR